MKLPDEDEDPWPTGDDELRGTTYTQYSILATTNVCKDICYRVCSDVPVSGAGLLPGAQGCGWRIGFELES
jgi:hypothetical protein